MFLSLPERFCKKNMKSTQAFILCFLMLISCQYKNRIVEIGQPVPDYRFNDLLNSNKKTISMHELKGKIVILEFWATWCSPCIPSIKKLDSLQSEFKDDIEILTVSREGKERLQRFIHTTGIELIMASDTIHSSIFKYRYIPHAIIIDRKGIVRAITSPDQITKDVLASLITNNEISLEIKDDYDMNPYQEVKLLKSIAEADYRINLSSYDQEKGGGYMPLKDSEGTVNGIEMWNSTLPRMYQTLFEVSSPVRIVFMDNLSYGDFPYEEEYQYNLTIEVSEKQVNNWKKLGIDFLDQYFEINAKMDVDSLECFVLKYTGKGLEESLHPTSEFVFRGPVLNTKKIKISRLISYLENFTSLPVADQTYLNGEYDIDLEWQFENPASLHNELKSYGFVLERSENRMPVEVMKVFRKK